MKRTFIALLWLAALPALAQHTATKVKPAHPTPPPAAPSLVRKELRKDPGAMGTLTASLVGVDDKSVSLRWNNPEGIDGIFDDFEAHNDFVVNSPGEAGWSYIDADNASTYTWTAADFPNQGQPMAFIVFNPSKTSPSTETWPDIQPYSGKKMLIDFTVDGGNNDYLISPELNFDEDFLFSFQARSYTESYGKERFRVGYSTTGTRPSDFTFIQEGDYAEVPAKWTLCQYTIPKEARYVCVNCVSQEAFMFMLDDIFIGTNLVRPVSSTLSVAASPRLKGFNLLRDGAKINEELLSGTYYTDEVPDYGTYSYTVQAVMTDGTAGPVSAPLEVEVPDTRLLPFEDDFDSNTIDGSLWERPADDKGNENKWKCDYYAYGLVDYSACYPYSTLGADYSQSLVTKELRTPDAAGTYLRFQVRLDNNPKYTGGYLSAEVSADDGQTWTSLVDIPNDEGTFAWRTYEYPLGDALNGAEFFRVRFRAHGSNAWEINYWYVDDVKIWCPEAHTATIAVTDGTQPLPGASVTLTADHGATYTGTTDSAGHYDIPRLETGHYEVEIEAANHNLLITEWDVTADEPATKTFTLLHPTATWSEAELNVSLAQEATETRTLTLSNNGTGPLSWSLDPQPAAQSGSTEHQFEPQESFDASGDLQSSVAFDGEYFYTASTYTLGRYYKYDRDGRFIEEFSIPGMYYKMYDLTYDGTYFYGSDYTNTIFQLDFRNKRLVREWQVQGNSSFTITHISYDPRSDQFWIGNWTKLGRVDREGKVTVDFFTLGESDDDIAVMGSAFDNVSQGGPYLWLANLSTSGIDKVDKVTLLQYDLNNRRLTGVSHSVIDVPGYKVGTEEMNYNNLGGISLTTQLHPGQLTLVGMLLQSPSRIFTYRMADFDSWYAAQPMSGTLQGGEQAQVSVKLDTRDFALGETRRATLRTACNPILDNAPALTLSLTANSPSACPRPVGLTAVADDSLNQISLTWQAAEGSTPAAYEVLRDSAVIATVAAPAYTDARLVRGTYSYAVRALYGTARTPSIESDTVQASIKVGVPCFAPVSPTATLARNSEVSLTWQQPDALLHQPRTLRWDSGQTDQAIGNFTENLYFYAGVAFDADDLEACRGMQISAVEAFIKESVQSLSLKIYKNGKAVKSQRVARGDIKYGEYNTVTLAEPLKIERGADYIVAFQIMPETDALTLGYSTGTAVEGKGNLLSEDGKTWYPASYAGLSGCNFNIALDLTPQEGYTEAAPDSYRILRAGKEVGVATGSLSFSEKLTAPATYSYRIISVYEGLGESAPSEEATVTVEDIGSPLPPARLAAEVERNSKVTLRWDFPLAATPAVPVDLTAAAGTSPDGRPEYVSSFTGALTGEMGFASDGKYIYTTRHSVAGVINRYFMDGTYDGGVNISSTLTDGFSNLTYDGANFWAAAKTSEIYKLNLAEPAITETRSISEVARHLAYVPTLDGGRGGFEVGDWETSIHVSMQGAKLADGPALKGAAGSAYHDGILYTFEQGYETAYELCARNFATGELLWHNSIADWTALTPSSGASAGGMSVLHTSEGLNLLCVALQERAGARFIFLDLGSVKGLEGYNVFRNGEKVNAAPLPARYFSEALAEPGTYTYRVQTQYVDGSVSELSPAQTVTIGATTAGSTPTDVKARATTAGYNVNISVVDPTSQQADQYESFENGLPTAANGFTVAEGEGFAGNCALQAPAETDCQLIFPVEQTYASGFAFSFVGRNADDDEGAGTVQVLTSAGSEAEADFINLASVSTSEAWTQFSFTLPAATRYVIVRCPAHYADQYLDAFTVHATLPGQAYGYDILRDGTQLNTEPAPGVTYTDHNLLPGTYSYQVRAHYANGTVSGWSEPVSVDVAYSNGNQAPGQLSVEEAGEGYLLKWSPPALSGVQELRWHNGISSGAAGLPSGGSYFAAVQFDPDDLAPHAAMSVSQISFYVNQVPDVLYVQLYEGADLVFEKYATSLRQYSMNTVSLDTPRRINPDKSLRAVIYVEHNEITVPLGYDEGPACTGRGDLYSSDGVTWETLTDNDIDGNWNITIGLQAYAATDDAQAAAAAKRGQNAERYVRHAAGQPARFRAVPQATAFSTPRAAAVSLFSGYNAYCNGELLNDTLLSPGCTQYLDQATHKGRYYEYQIKVLYSGYGEVGSNIVRVLHTGIGHVTDGTENETLPAYTVGGRPAYSGYRGPVIRKGSKRMR